MVAKPVKSAGLCLRESHANMNVAFILKTKELSGTQKRSAKIARALNNRGHNVSLFMNKETYRALTSKNYNFDWPPVVIWSYPLWIRALGISQKKRHRLREALGINKLNTWARKRFWARLFAQHEIDVAHMYLTWKLSSEIPIPHIFEITSPDMARRIIERWPNFPPETILHPNSEVVDAVLADNFPNNRKMVVPHAFFDPDEPANYEPPEKENLVVFGHRLVARKNPVIFARAAKRFLAARPDWKVAIRGDGPLADETRSVLSDEIASGRALFGFEPNLMNELHRSRIFVSIEIEDNYSNQSVLEAMWCKNAVVLSDRGRTRARYFADNGVLCEPNEDSVFDALVSLADDPTKLEYAATKSRNLVETSFSKGQYLDHLIKVYQSALGDKSG